MSFSAHKNKHVFTECDEPEKTVYTLTPVQTTEVMKAFQSQADEHKKKHHFAELSFYWQPQCSSTVKQASTV